MSSLASPRLLALQVMTAFPVAPVVLYIHVKSAALPAVIFAEAGSTGETPVTAAPIISGSSGTVPVACTTPTLLTVITKVKIWFWFSALGRALIQLVMTGQLGCTFTTLLVTLPGTDTASPELLSVPDAETSNLAVPTIEGV